MMIATDTLFDIDELLSPISPESPCGEDLEYDPAFGEMERAAEGTPEQQFGSTVVEAQEPDWREVRGKALELLGRTKDLRIATYLCRALLPTSGLVAFGDGLRVIAGFIQSYWNDIHPRLDPDDDNDPTMRVNALVSLNDPDSSLKILRTVPIVQSRKVGRFSLRDIGMAMGEIPNDRGAESALDMNVIHAAFEDVELDELTRLQTAIGEAIQSTRDIETALTENAGVGKAVSFSPLVGVLQEIQRVYGDQLARRGVSGSEDVAVDGNTESSSVEPGSAATQPAGISGDITTRADVLRMLDKAMEYYRQEEPTSPVPLLLGRAKRLANLSFLEILKDLAPGGLSQAEAIGGVPSGSDGAA
jgi:type VI secretion system protein ImpA